MVALFGYILHVIFTGKHATLTCFLEMISMSCPMAYDCHLSPQQLKQQLPKQQQRDHDLIRKISKMLFHFCWTGFQFVICNIELNNDVFRSSFPSWPFISHHGRPQAWARGGTCFPPSGNVKCFCIVKCLVDELFMHYFHNLSSASEGFAPRPSPGFHPWAPAGGLLSPDP